MAPILGYWTLRGLAEPIRYILAYTGTEYEEKLYDFGPTPDTSEWDNGKDKLGLEFPNLPYYIDGDVSITESLAIIKYIARKHDLVPVSEEDKIRDDMSCGIVGDATRATIALAYNDNYETAKGPFIANIKTPLQKLDKLVGSRKFVFGDKITFVDFMLLESLDRHEALVPGCLGDFPNLKKYQQRMSDLPAIKKYRASPAFKKIETRFNGRMGHWGSGKY